MNGYCFVKIAYFIRNTKTPAPLPRDLVELSQKLVNVHQLSVVILTSLGIVEFHYFARGHNLPLDSVVFLFISVVQWIGHMPFSRRVAGLTPGR